jgi:hypothetical protein
MGELEIALEKRKKLLCEGKESHERKRGSLVLYRKDRGEREKNDGNWNDVREEREGLRG